MFSSALFFLVALSSSPPATLSPPSAIADEYTQADGQRVRWAAVSYVLPTGEAAELFVAVDESHHGEGWLMVEGETLAHVSYDGTDTGTETDTDTEWLALDTESGAAALFGLDQGVADELFFALGPQEFGCSEFGVGVLQAGKFIWVGMVAATGAACCGLSGLGACVACAAGGALAAEAGTEALNGYCD